MNSNNTDVPPPYHDTINKIGLSSTGRLPQTNVVYHAVPQNDPNNLHDGQQIPVINQVQLVPVMQLNKQPTQCMCPHCRASIITRVECTNGLLAWLLCLLLVLVGCSLGCCLIPFCVKEVQNVQHYCPNCNNFIGEYRPL